MPETASAAATAEAGDAGLPPVQSDARILESRKELGRDRRAYRPPIKVNYSKRILTYAGKIRESEIKIPFNPA